MEYFSLILSIGILFFVIRLMTVQRRFDWLNGATITGALIVVLLDIDTIYTGRKYDVTPFISLTVLILWVFNTRRKPLEVK
jgi:hypothetical protein